MPMMVEDILPTLIVVVVIYLLVRWFTGSKNSTATDGSIRGVTPAMVDTVHSAFPNTPISNIIYHLSITRSTQATMEEILERGVLPTPPPSFSIPASLIPASSTAPPPTVTTSNKAVSAKSQSLIDRYNLTSRVPSKKGKEKETESVSVSAPVSGAGQSGGKWEDSRDKRELSLKERKEKMILEARKRMLDKQAKDQDVEPRADTVN